MHTRRRLISRRAGFRMKSELEFVASDVQGAVITDSGHWIMKEQPQQALAIITKFIAGK